VSEREELEYFDYVVQDLHVHEVEGQDTDTFDSEKYQMMKCYPRPSPKFLGDRNKLRTPWNWSLSVFKHFKSDTE
jgi:hypothetical protein